MSYKNKKTIQVSTSSESSDDSTQCSSSESDSGEDVYLVNKVPIKSLPIKVGQDFREMITKDINEDYGMATYFDLQVIVMKSTGFVNCTEMCEYFSRITESGKKFKYWHSSITSNLLIKELASSSKTLSNNLVIDIRNESTPGINGKYCAQELIPAIICWASPAYFITMANIVNKHFVEKIKGTELQIQLDTNKKLLNYVEELLDRTDKIIDQNNDIVENTKNIRKITKTNPDDHNKFAFYIIENNDKVKKGVTVYNYGIVRTDVAGLTTTMTKYKNKHPNMIMIAKIPSNDKSENLWGNMREYLRNENKITGISSQFNLCEDVSIKNVIKSIEKFHNANINMDTNI